ncbi:MAG: hypothetical protein K940chlam9_01495 [Chlamydiae bacterium]|nr:hypothetical protein [Chlamydiota bacterium]
MDDLSKHKFLATSHKVEVNSDFHSKKSVLYREDCMNQKYTSPQLYEKLQFLPQQKNKVDHREYNQMLLDFICHHGGLESI